MTKCIRATCLLVIATLINACSSPVHYESGHQKVDFSQLKTYRWVPDKVKRPFPEIANHVVATGNKELKSKGFVLKPKGDVDFLMSFDITSESDIDVSTHQIFGGIGLGFEWRRNQGIATGPYHKVGDSRSAKIVGQGTLILDVINPANEQVIWRSVASKEMNIKHDPDSTDPAINVYKASKTVDRAVAYMLEDFPPED